MKPNTMNVLIGIAFLISACQKKDVPDPSLPYRMTKSIAYNNVQVDVVIDKPEGEAFDVLVVYHGTVVFDAKILEAANTTLDQFRKILDRKDMMIISVAYPEENLFMGDNLKQAEAALLWVQEKAGSELGIRINKIFLGGHSQGGYLVTRLNTLYKTNGVIANGPGPLNLVYRCRLEENGQVSNSVACTLLKNSFGTTIQDTSTYSQRSLLQFTKGFKSDILFVQGLNDSPIQLNSWPQFKQQVTDCTTCQARQFVDVPNSGHTALFESSEAREIFNHFINR